jgi:hypothetical protein
VHVNTPGRRSLIRLIESAKIVCLCFLSTSPFVDDDDDDEDDDHDDDDYDYDYYYSSSRSSLPFQLTAR